MKSGLRSTIARIAMRALPSQRSAGIVAMVALASILLCGATAPVGCKPEPPPSHTGAEVAGISILVGAAVGTVVLVEMHHSSHTIEGCVSASPNGLEVQNLKDNKIYMLAGATANTKVGDVVRLHGSKEKAGKGDNAAAKGDPTFMVQKVTRDFGPCKLSAPAVSATGGPSEAQDAQ